MVQIVKKRMGLTGQKNRILFDVLAEHYRVPRPTKLGGLDLVYRYADEHRGTPLPKSQAKSRVRVATKPSPAHGDFLRTYAWRSLRMAVLTERGARCECCGATPQTGAVMNVDHIKPRLKFPHLALAKSNLQVLCDACNHGKGNWDETDWRQPLVDPMAPRLVRRETVN
jgi:hypothetical protein